MGLMIRQSMETNLVGVALGFQRFFAGSRWGYNPKCKNAGMDKKYPLPLEQLRSR